ncbi:hypothetical protein F4806DRAFT_467159 [Annulohypoxylon nitens]|nr:hypothetical protein F4806DRAFT_467159 [Annulohypoxylon nitens]
MVGMVALWHGRHVRRVWWMVVATRLGSQMGSQTDRLGSTITTIPTSAPAIHTFTFAHFHTTNPFPFPFFLPSLIREPLFPSLPSASFTCYLSS